MEVRECGSQRVKFEDGRVNNVTQLMRQPFKTTTVSNNYQTVQFLPGVWKDRIRHGISIIVGGAAYNAADFLSEKIGIPYEILQKIVQGSIASSTAAFIGFGLNKLLTYIPFFKNENYLENYNRRIDGLEDRIDTQESPVYMNISSADDNYEGL